MGGSRPTEPWAPARFKIAGWSGPQIMAGWELNGLGLDLRSQFRSRYRRKDGTRKVTQTWVLSHLNTGHAVRTFRDVGFTEMMAAATDLALMVDWSFQGLDGWQNVAPDLPDKMQDWHRRWSLAAKPGSGHRCEESAKVIGMERW